jgi:muconolactone delta-isomerase
LTITVPADTPVQVVDDTRAREARRASELAGQGHLLRLWVPPDQPDQPGQRRTLGLWRAADAAEMTAVLESLPLYVWMTAEVTPLTAHPSDPQGTTS